MANLKYYSFRFQFFKVSSLSLSLLYVKHDISPVVHNCWNWDRGSREAKNLFFGYRHYRSLSGSYRSWTFLHGESTSKYQNSSLVARLMVSRTRVSFYHSSLDGFSRLNRIIMSENTDLYFRFKGPDEDVVEGPGYQRCTDRNWFAKCWATSIREGAEEGTVAIRLAEKSCAPKIACYVWISIIFVFRFFE